LAGEGGREGCLLTACNQHAGKASADTLQKDCMACAIPSRLSAVASVAANNSRIEKNADNMVWIAGGKFDMGSDDYCMRYKSGSRGKGEITSASDNLGFRCVKNK